MYLYQGQDPQIAGEKNEFPWLVALVRERKVKPDCGGTLLSSRTVLTAAHCKRPENTREYRITAVLLGQQNRIDRGIKGYVGSFSE